MATKTALWLAGLVAIGGMSLQATAAQVYKWTDSNGVTHYSENPPPSDAKQSTTVKVKTRLPEGYDQAQQNRQKALEAQKENTKSAAATAANKDATKPVDKERCAALRTNLETMTTNPRVRVQDEKTGELRVLTEEEKNKQLDDTKKRIKEEC